MRRLELRMLPRSAPRPVPPLPASRPRPVRLTGTGWLVAVIGALLPAGALVAGFSLHARAVREPGLPFWVGPVAALAIAVSSIFPWYAIRRQWMLLEEGRGTMAQVTLSKKVRHQHGSRFRVSYEFRTMSGATRSGGYDCQKGPPATGTSIQVVYNPDRPERSAPYPLALVRPA